MGLKRYSALSRLKWRARNYAVAQKDDVGSL